MAEIISGPQDIDLPVVTQEEADDLTQALSSLADTEVSDSDAQVFAEGADDDTGGSKLKNVFYINFIPQNSSHELAKEFTELKENVDLNSSFMSTRANMTVKDKLGQLKNDQAAMATYKAKVINYLASNAPWTAAMHTETISKEFTAEKDTFHKQLVNTFTEGLQLSSNIAEKLEGILTSARDTINVSVGTNPRESLTIFIWLNTYTKDDAWGTWRSYFRTIYLRVDDSLSSYTKKKVDGSSGIKNNVRIEYVLSDGQFNDSLFAGTAKAAISQMLNGRTISSIDKPDDVLF